MYVYMRAKIIDTAAKPCQGSGRKVEQVVSRTLPVFANAKLTVVSTLVENAVYAMPSSKFASPDKLFIAVYSILLLTCIPTTNLLVSTNFSLCDYTIS